MLLEISPNAMAGMIGHITFIVLVAIVVIWAIRKAASK